MIKIELKNKDNQIITGRIDHEKPEAPFVAEGDTLAVLAIKQYLYQVGDKIVVTYTGATPYLMVQLDETLAPSLIYLKEKVWEYQIPLEESARKAFVDTAFHSARHQIMVRQAHTFEKDNYQNLSMNTHDQKEYSGAYPHAYANVETRDDAVSLRKMRLILSLVTFLMARIHLLLGELTKKEAQLTIDFGRPVETDWIRLLFRADYPHDSYWEEVTLAFQMVRNE